MTVVVVVLLLLLAVVLWFRVPRRELVPTAPPSRVELQSPGPALVNEPYADHAEQIRLSKLTGGADDIPVKSTL